MSLDLAAVVAGTKYRGQFEERLKQIMQEIRRSPDVLIFIDELHTLVGAGAAEGAIDASNMLKPALSRGELQCIGATTQEEFRKYIEKDGALERRFQPIHIDPPTVAETIEILQGLRSRYEEHHGVIISDEALDAAAHLTDRYISGRLPSAPAGGHEAHPAARPREENRPARRGDPPTHAGAGVREVQGAQRGEGRGHRREGKALQGVETAA
jgi:ATP-dependent Clp protease ATP-binding subunit ClpA